ncbi:MAG: succinate dehydrogenase, cytochrome b556 subunit [Legionellales bacterium]|nr:succinate dehydrogenase, cytochrome b556 subunit [Legionellales bacterium]|tara:strand:+ start:1244 stop:1621 length:378 start_codon:yes stop_codon:yes gene_type:complete
MSKNKRPVYLNLSEITLPYPALVSILHRVSGVALIFSFPFLLPILAHIKNGSFTRYMIFLDSLPGRIILWLILSGISYHIISGIRHLWSDFMAGESLHHARLTAKTTLLCALIASVFFFIHVVVL